MHVIGTFFIVLLLIVAAVATRGEKSYGFRLITSGRAQSLYAVDRNGFL
jgi:hypothetical protein